MLVINEHRFQMKNVEELVLHGHLITRSAYQSKPQGMMVTLLTFIPSTSTHIYKCSGDEHF